MDETVIFRAARLHSVIWLIVFLGGAVSFLSDFTFVRPVVVASAAAVAALIVCVYVVKVRATRIEVTPDIVRYIGSGIRSEEVPRSSVVSLDHFPGQWIFLGHLQVRLADSIAMEVRDYWTQKQLTQISDLLGVTLRHH